MLRILKERYLPIKVKAILMVRKSDARPGGYIATGDHGGVLGTIRFPGAITVYFTPLTRHIARYQEIFDTH